jgi:hypothetical protein
MRLPARSAGARQGAAAQPTPLPRAKALTRLGRRLRVDEGFTLVEVLAATLIVVVGLITAASILIITDHADVSVRAREGAVALARQVTEDVRSIDYSQISSTTLASTLQSDDTSLANTSSGSTWTVTRGPSGNVVTYTIGVSVNSFSDAHDTSATPSSTDVKQVTVTIGWTTFQGTTHQYSETTTLTAAGQDPGLIASNLQLVPSSANSGTAFAPVITSAATSLQFKVTAPSGTSAIVWTLNGGKQSAWAGSTPTTGSVWTSGAWSLSGVSDGTYTVGAQAEDANGVLGPTVTIPVRLIRNVPSAPTVSAYGFNSNVMVNGAPTTEAEVQWSANPEANIVGYQITSHGSTCQTSTTSFSSTSCSNWWCFSPESCIDLNSPSDTSSATYSVQALYFNASNVETAGTATSVVLPSGTPSPPPQVPQVTLTAVTEPDDSGILTWTPPATAGLTPVSFYRIYRDGDNYSNRYDTVSASSCSATCSYHDTNRITGHSYYITAVSATLAESAPTGPVTG